MNHIYLLRLKTVLAVLGIIAVITGCSGEKNAEVQTAVVDPPAPATIEDTPDPVVVDEDEQVINDFKTKVRACFEQLLDDDTVVSLLYSRFYQESNGWPVTAGSFAGFGGTNYGSWYADNVNYGGLMSYWPVGQGVEEAKADVCQNGLKKSVSGLARLSGSGRYNPFEVSNFVGDMGLAVSNQGRLGGIYSRLGSFFAKPLGSGNWGIGIGSGAGAQFFKTNVNASTSGFLEKVRNRLTDRGAFSGDAIEVTGSNIPSSLPRGIGRQLRGLMAATREANGTTAEIHQSAQKALSTRHLLK